MAAASMTLAVLFLAGCSREQAEPSAQQEISEAVTSGPVTCYARYESLGAAGGDAATKADIDDDGAFTWASDGSDCIAVYNGASTYSLTHVTPGGRFTATRYSGTTYPVYPYESASSGDNITYPDSHTITGSMGYSSHTPMMAVDGGSGDLTFYHVGSLLRLTLENVPVGTKSIEVTLTRSSGYSTGTGTVSNPGTSTSSASITSGGNKVTFNLATATVMASNGFMLNVPVPPGTYTGIYVACKDTDGNDIAIALDATSHTLARAQGSRITITATIRTADITVDSSDKWLMNTKYVTYGLYTQTAKSTFSVNSDPFAILLQTRTNGTAPTSSYPNYYHQYATVSSVSGVTFNGNSTWAIPSKSDFDSIIASGSATVNGTANVRWARVSVDVSNSTYAGKGYTNSSQYVPGLLLFPNSSTVTVNGITNTGAADFTTNVISYVDCKYLYENGCVFLPAAGGDYGGRWYAVGSGSLYWSSTADDSKSAYVLYFGSSIVDSDRDDKTGYSPVVLVR